MLGLCVACRVVAADVCAHPARLSACVRACVCLRVCVCVRARVRVCVCVTVCRAQEQVQKLAIGSIPRSLIAVLSDDLVDMAKPGDDVTVHGASRRMPLSVANNLQHGDDHMLD